MSTTTPSVHTRPGHLQHPAPSKQSPVNDNAPEPHDLDRTHQNQISVVPSQVNSIEQQLHETKTEVRLGALEENVFGSARA
jgi:hypothetical protein